MKRLILLLTLMLVGCAGRSFNPKATMCVDPAFSSDDYEAFLDAGQEWHDKTNGEVDFRFRSGEGCEVDLKPVARLRYDDNAVALGITDTWFQWIQFDVNDSWVTSSGRTITSDYYPLRETALHEFGHYLTGGRHSPSKPDTMYAKGQPIKSWDNEKGEATYREPRHLTEADLARWNGKNHSFYQDSDPYPAEVIEPE